MLRTARRYAKRHGQTVDELLMEVLYSQHTTTRDRLWAIKLFKEFTMAKIAEGGDADRSLAPALFLPEHHPALRVVSGGKGE